MALHPSWRRAMASVIILPLSFVGLLAQTTPTQAAGGGDGCNPQRANNGAYYFDGWSSTPSGTINGVYTEIYNYSPWVYPGNEVYA